jgi:hypothetical protein
MSVTYIYHDRPLARDELSHQEIMEQEVDIMLRNVYTEIFTEWTLKFHKRSENSMRT